MTANSHRKRKSKMSDNDLNARATKLEQAVGADALAKVSGSEVGYEASEEVNSLSPNTDRPQMEMTSAIEDELRTLVEDANFEARGGHVANYIPELVLAPEEKTGVAIRMVDGENFQVGDSNRYARNPENGSISRESRRDDDSFTIQSTSKVFSLLYVLESSSNQEVFKRMRKEPTGDPFNAAPKGDLRMPDNPLINVGAILTTSMWPAVESDEGLEKSRFSEFLEFVRYLVGSDAPLIVDDAVFQSERKTGHNNRALAWQMSADGVFRQDQQSDILRAGSDELSEEELALQRDNRVAEVNYVEEVLDNYFRQCSILVTAKHLADAAAVLAFGGKRPNSPDFKDAGKQILDPKNVKTVVALMSSCGMYDGSGQFAHDVGIPAKSGVGGGIMCVVPGKAGIATYAPPLDPQGNSVRGLYILKTLSDRYRLSLFNQPAEDCNLSRYSTSESLEGLTERARNNIVLPSEEFRKQDYIPELGAQDALHTGLAICHAVKPKSDRLIVGGDHDVRFTMQSISTLFGFIYALKKQSEGIVFQYVGKEPSGEPFSKLKWKVRETEDNKQRIPFNPMINAGAILISAMIPQRYTYKHYQTDLSPDGDSVSLNFGSEEPTIEEKKVIGTGTETPSGQPAGRVLSLLDIDDFLDFVRDMCGNREIDINWQVFDSERRTGYKNRSIAWDMNDEGVFDRLLKRHGKTVDAGVIEDILSVYFRLCSIMVSCSDLARAAAVLANEGRDLDTGRFLVPPRIVAIASAMMSSSGMFDGSGEYADSVGIPAKSGVSGGIMACVPGKFGIGAFSPVVDPKGNSYRSMKMLEELSASEGLGIFFRANSSFSGNSK